jgi:hypothetical protein
MEDFLRINARKNCSDFLFAEHRTNQMRMGMMM